MDKESFNFETAQQFIENEFKNIVITSLSEFIKIPNLSPSYDPTWQTNGNQEKAANFLINYANNQGIKGLKAELIETKGRTPMIVIEISAQNSSKNYLIYGHFDKQPHLEGWYEGLGPTTPVIKGDLLYGRGSSDDGYALFSVLASIKAVQSQNKSHGRIIILIEGAEESSCEDLNFYLNSLNDRIGVPDLLICLDSGCLDYETLWITSSLRGY